MKRKTFLKTSLAAGASFTILPSGLWGSSQKNSTMRLAQIGTGRMGQGDMMNALNNGHKSHVNARMVAVCDVDRSRAEDARKKVIRNYENKGESDVDCDLETDFRNILSRDDIDGVVVSTPENWHALIGVAAANAGKHIYLQKPLTYSIPEGKELVKAVRKNNVVLQTGSQQRSSIYFRQICSIIRNNWLGELKKIEVEIPTDKGRADGEATAPPADFNYDMWLGPCPEAPYIESRVHPENNYSRPGWLQVNRYCLGMITGWGSHMYDIAQWGNGTDVDSGPTSIQASGQFPDRGLFDVHVGYEGEAHYGNSVVMTSSNGRPGVKFITEEGWAYCERGGMDCSDKKLLRRKPKKDEVNLYNSSNHMEDFLVSAREGTDPICPVEVGHRSNTICVLHDISMKLGGRKLNWDPTKEEIVGDVEASKLMHVPMRAPYNFENYA
ncbi:gfo/Idh/MocA family oxidoreductase [Coraliomargarita sinensis]|uniref:Gfo/Idh/MocA family oxidoreductase n=1 Tax=Coraliomargarita sinensis TaxID=2174842 RepID=A0A317ZKX2_9BACT|nr:Gfo/Idh/MocA family oxidoreductase [Coraliomargarita sinensis]PXA04588.1 gfo/Idh/MocA family oxidoreductase [Coraliomargarita sinensis]